MFMVYHNAVVIEEFFKRTRRFIVFSKLFTNLFSSFNQRLETSLLQRFFI